MSQVCATSGRKLLRAVIVEDEPLFCEVIRKLAEESRTVHVVGVASNGADAVQVVKRECPNHVIMDLGLPGLDGFSLILETRRWAPATRFLVVTANSDDYTMFRLSRAKVHGVVDKRSDDITTLRNAIHTFLDGGAYFARSYQDAARRREEQGGTYGDQLTEREREVLMLAGLGLSNTEIGLQLGISAETAERHRNTLFRKLDISRTPKLMDLANKNGFTRIPPGGHGPPVYP